MADISKIKLPNGTTYNIKDAEARTEISDIKEKIVTGMNYIGITTTMIEDNDTTTPITIDGKSIIPKKGDLVIYENLEFIYNGIKWQELGDPTAKGLGDLAYKDNASTIYTPQGTVSQSTFTGTETTLTETITPAGTVTAPIITVTPTNTTVTPLNNVGTLPSCTLPTLEATVENDVLSLDWTAGSFSAGTLPTKGEDVQVVESITASASAPTFTGTEIEISIDYTPTGTISQPTFTGTETTITVS